MGFSFKVGNKTGCGDAKKKHASRNGFVSRYELLGRVQDSPCGECLRLAAIGRQAPVKRCLARFAKLSFRIFFAGRLMPRPTAKESLYP